MKTEPRRVDDVARPGDSPLGTSGEAPSFIWANLGVMLLVAVAVIAGAAIVSWSRVPLFTSTAEVVVEPRVNAAGGAAQMPDMATEKALASSGTVLDTASRALGVPADQLLRGLSITVPVDTRVLRMAYSHPDAPEARRRANGIAEAYVADANSGELAAQPHAVIITAASLPTWPSSPNHMVDLVVGLVVGLALGLGVAFVRDRRDDRFRSLADFEEHVGAPVLGVIPAMSRAATKTGARLVTIGDAESAAAGAYRDLRTRLVQIADRQSAKTVLVASPAGDHKAAVAANLAMMLAMSGNHVVLVCAEVRPPDLLDGLGVTDGVGFTDLVDGAVGLDRALCVSSLVGLRVVTAGSRLRDPGAIFQPLAVRQVLAELRNAFDFTVLAAPPVLSGADTGFLAESAEMVLLVGDARRSTRSQVAAAIHQLESSRSKLIGCVLDNVGKRRPWLRARLRRPMAGEAKRTTLLMDPDGKRRPTTGEAERTAWLTDSGGRARKIYPKATPEGPADEVPVAAEETVGEADGMRTSPSMGKR